MKLQIRKNIDFNFEKFSIAVKESSEYLTIIFLSLLVSNFEFNFLNLRNSMVALVLLCSILTFLKLISLNLKDKYTDYKNKLKEKSEEESIRFQDEYLQKTFIEKILHNKNLIIYFGLVIVIFLFHARIAEVLVPLLKYVKLLPINFNYESFASNFDFKYLELSGFAIANIRAWQHILSFKSQKKIIFLTQKSTNL